MNNEAKWFGINMDSFWAPELIRGKRGYVGTEKDFTEFCRALEADYTFKYKYGDLINQIRNDLDAHSGNHGLQGVNYGKELDSNHVLSHDAADLIDCHWKHYAYNEAVYPMYASRVHIDRLVIERCGEVFSAIKGCMEDLHVCLQSHGWVCLRGEMRGFPETVCYDDDVYQMRLYAIANDAVPADANVQLKSIEEDKELYLRCCSGDIIAEGPVIMAKPMIF